MRLIFQLLSLTVLAMNLCIVMRLVIILDGSMNIYDQIGWQERYKANKRKYDKGYLCL